MRTCASMKQSKRQTLAGEVQHILHKLCENFFNRCFSIYTTDQGRLESNFKSNNPISMFGIVDSALSSTLCFLVGNVHCVTQSSHLAENRSSQIEIAFGALVRMETIMYACHLMKNSAFKLRGGKKSSHPDPSLHNDTSVKILFKSVKVQSCSAAQFVRKHGIMCQGQKICCLIPAIGSDKICFFQIITCCSRKVAFLN